MKTLKDMLDNLYALYPDISFDQLEVIEYVHAGLFCQVLRVDRPTQYMTRILNFAHNCIFDFFVTDNIHQQDCTSL